MKFNSNPARAHRHAGEARLLLDSVFNGLLIAAGAALSVAAAADAALDLRAAPAVAAQTSATRGDDAQHIAVRGRGPTRNQRIMESSPRTKS